MTDTKQGGPEPARPTVRRRTKGERAKNSPQPGHAGVSPELQKRLDEAIRTDKPVPGIYSDPTGFV